ncbi:SDR family oxidoreductase [Sphingobium algorifonticola]|uniref:NAD-dependent epimerase/dehydratase family protein n=1 Tax=Sphingobium algorifonticola TaxID=2008318 RepID=A0A437J5P5_9SPHN|nr:SDR family oxidoreductase [Sphingobium algorifonticola]RVT40171.1 NAD-dependent epimerase/dehydratase family protein [Sphingobium algorifonticola]
MSQTAFVTGATGLLGNNLVRLLSQKGWRVKALARSREKASRQLGGIANVEIVLGDMTDVAGFADSLVGSDVLFHTAAHFRDSYKGGDHWPMLHRINVSGTRALLQAAHAAGVRRMIHTSSIAVLDGPRGATMNETMLRALPEKDAYYRSKVMSDREVQAFLERHPDFSATFVLPGWMHGPGDVGPTQAGQTVMDFVNRKLPGIVPATFAFVDARDVALAQIAAAERGGRGERYLAAGRHMAIAELFDRLEALTGVPGPKRRIPAWQLYVIAGIAETIARISGKPALLSWATVQVMMQERERSRFDHSKSEAALGLTFRPVDETLRDEIAWFRANGFLAAGPSQTRADPGVGQPCPAHRGSVDGEAWS